MALAPRDIGLRIKAARERKHWTQQDFSNKANVSLSSVSRWESGKLPPVRELLRLAELLEIEPEELVEPSAPPPDEVSERLLAVEERLGATESLLERIAKAIGA